MSTQLQSLFDAALQLPEPEGGELAARLIDTLDEDLEKEEEAAEVQRHIDDVRSGAAATVPWEVVRQKMVDMNNATTG